MTGHCILYLPHQLITEERGGGGVWIEEGRRGYIHRKREGEVR